MMRDSATVPVRPHARAAVAALLLPLQIAGCVTYRPIEPVEVRAPTPVRVVLSAEGAVRVTRDTGRPVQSVDGEFLALVADSVRLRITRNEEFGARLATRDTITLPLTEIASLQEKRISRGRTILAAGAATVVVALLAVSLFRSSGGGGEEDGGPPDQLVVPVLIRIR